MRTLIGIVVGLVLGLVVARCLWRSKRPERGAVPAPRALPEDRRRELLLEEYRLVGELVRYEGNVFWQRHNLYLAVNAAILASLALAKWPEGDVGAIDAAMLLRCLSVAGCLVALAWLVTTWGGRRWCRTWDGLMKHLERDETLALPTRVFTVAVPDTKGWSWCMQRLYSVRAWSLFLPFTFSFLWVYVLSWSVWSDGFWIPKWVWRVLVEPLAQGIAGLWSGL
jgi:hypothetical protein